MPSQAKKLRSASLLMIAATGLQSLSMAYFRRSMSANLGNDYSRLDSLLAISNVLSSVTMGVNIFLVKEFSRDLELKGPGAVKGRLASLLQPLGLTLLGFGALLLGAGPWVMDYLHLPSFFEYSLVVGLFLFGLVLLVWRAAVQGIQHFNSLGLSVSLEGLGRAVLGTVWVTTKGVAGGLFGALGGQGLGWVAAAWGLRGAGPSLEPPPHAEERSAAGVRLKEILGDTATLLLFSVLGYLDLFITRHYYDNAGASAYGRAGLVAKSFLYLAAALNMILLPAVAAAREGGRDSKGILLRFLGAALMMNLLGLALVWRFTDFCLRILCGPDPAFLALSPLVRFFSVAMILQALFQMVLFYLLAMRQRSALWIMLLVVPLYYALLVLNHEQPVDVVQSLMTVSIVALALGLWAAWRPLKPAANEMR